MDQMKVILSNKHTMIREVLAEVLMNHLENIRIVGMSADKREYLERLKEPNVDIIITNMNNTSDETILLNDIQEKERTTELTKRELEVLRLLTRGLLNKEIADQLSISEKTVKNHVSNIFKKMGVSDRTQAAVYAIKDKVVSI